MEVKNYLNEDNEYSKAIENKFIKSKNLSDEMKNIINREIKRLINLLQKYKNTNEINNKIYVKIQQIMGAWFVSLGPTLKYNKDRVMVPDNNIEPKNIYSLKRLYAYNCEIENDIIHEFKKIIGVKRMNDNYGYLFYESQTIDILYLKLLEDLQNKNIYFFKNSYCKILFGIGIGY